MSLIMTVRIRIESQPMRMTTPMMIAATMMTKMKTWLIIEGIEIHHRIVTIKEGGEKEEARVILMTSMRMRLPVATIKDTKLRLRVIPGLTACGESRKVVSLRGTRLRKCCKARCEMAMAITTLTRMTIMLCKKSKMTTDHWFDWSRDRKTL